MNQRIKQLADEATTIVDTVNSQGYSSSYANFDREKFAELIVRECAEIADTAEPFLASDLIKQQFGVEK